MSQIRFFQPADGGEWHAYREESAQALCGEAQLSYNRDRVADAVPTDGALHDGCRQAIDAENPAAYTPHPGDAIAEPAETEAATDDNQTPTETDGGETPTTESTEANPDGGETPEDTETQTVGSGDVASVASILGGESNTGDQQQP